MKNDGGSAFPRPTGLHGTHTSDPTFRITSNAEGMSLRDYFAATSLTLGEGVWPGGHMPENATEIARYAYLIADAMLKERSKSDEQ